MSTLVNRCKNCQHEWRTVLPPVRCPQCAKQSILREKKPFSQKEEKQVEKMQKSLFSVKVSPPKISAVAPSTNPIGVMVPKKVPPKIKTRQTNFQAMMANSDVASGIEPRVNGIKLKPRSVGSPHIIVDALAGTGKSFTILEDAYRKIGIQRPNIVGTDEQEAIWEATKDMQVAPEDIAILAFNTAIRDEMKVKAPPGVYVNTCHAFGKSILAIKGVQGARTKYGVRKKKSLYILADILGVEYNDMFSQYKWNLLFLIKQFVGFCKLNLITFTGDMENDSAIIRHLAFIHGCLLPQKDKDEVFFYSMVMQVYNLSHTRLDVIDFDDMLWLPWKLNYRGRSFKMLYGDERQDFNLAQQELICNHGDRLFLAGDKNQAIYGFAGADIKACETMDKRLSMPGRGVVRFPLTYTRRCSKAVVEYARKIVPDFNYFPDAAQGLIDNGKEETFLEDVNNGDMVVCRTNAPLFICCLKLFRQGRPFRTTVKNEFEQCLNLIKSFNALSLDYLDEKLREWKSAQLKRCKGANSDRAIIIIDTYDSIKAGMEMVSSVEELVDLIEKVFGISKKGDNDDEGQDKIRGVTNDRIYMSSIHQAKGLEAHRVWWLQYDLVPHPKAQLMEQETNLKWVASTRAIDTLVLVKSKQKKCENDDEWE